VAGEQIRAVLLCDFLSIAPLYIESLNSAEEHHLSAVFCVDWSVRRQMLGFLALSFAVVASQLIFLAFDR